MKTNPSKLLLSAVAISVVASLSVSATELKPYEQREDARHKFNGTPGQVNFADWYKEQQKEKYLDVTDKMIVKFDDANVISALKSGDEGKTASSRASFDKAQSLLNVMGEIAGSEVTFERTLSGGKAVLSFAKAQDMKTMTHYAKLISSHSGVGGAEPDPRRYLLSQMQPWGIGSVQADIVSDGDAGNKTVCIIDSGYEISNEDLAGNNVTGTNDSGTGNWYSAGGSHGTHVAGTIAGINNSVGVVGVMPNQNINLHIVKVFNAAGWGYSSDLIDAVNICVNNGADVVNMSLGGSSSSNAERSGMQSALDSGVLLVAAAGNDGDSTHSYPASYDAVMSVAAVDESGQHAEFSQFTSQVEISGPGEAILSTVAGDGRQGYLNYGSTSLGDDRVVPQSRYIASGGSYVVSNVNGSVSGDLATCSLSGNIYNCGNMNGKICVAERNDNQSGSTYPEINPAKACADAGAEGVVVYSNSERPGLQKPFLVDDNSDVSVPTVSVNRSTGQALAAAAGTAATLSVEGNKDYSYYNGTSMASPHVAGAAALAWSTAPNCTVTQVREALKSSALDLDSSGRDNRTGYGLVQTKAAADVLANDCGGVIIDPPTGTELTNGTPVTGLAASAGDSSVYTLEVPAGATDLAFNMSGGSGDADLYVSFGSEPSTSSYDCRSWASGNTESCSFNTAQAGTYYVKVVAYNDYSGASLTGSYTEPTSTEPGDGGSAELTGLSARRNNWLNYTLDVPAGMTSLTMTTSGGSGDADLYVRFGAEATASNYDCRSWDSGNTESCTFNNPAEGTWHIDLKAYRTFSGLTLRAVWE